LPGGRIIFINLKRPKFLHRKNDRRFGNMIERAFPFPANTHMLTMAKSKEISKELPDGSSGREKTRHAGQIAFWRIEGLTPRQGLRGKG